MSGLNNKRYLDGDGLLKFWEICCANFPHKDGRGATGNWNINITGTAATSTLAATAGKLNTNAGSATKPIYFGEGIPKQCNNLIDVNISGNAATADEADKWSNTRKITLTGGVTGEVDIDGSDDVEIATTVVSTAHTHNQYYDKNTSQSPNTVYAGPSSGTAAGVASFRKLVAKDIPDLSGIYLPKSGGMISGNGADLLGINRIDGNPAIVFYHNNSTMGRLGFNTTGDAVAQIGGEYKTLLHEGNFNTYSPKLDGTGATGTWGINISGNAGTATKLQTTRTIWGQSFDGSKNIAGDMSGVGKLSMSGALTLTGTAATDSWIKFSRQNYNYITWPQDYSLAFGALEGEATPGSVNTICRITKTSFIPERDNEVALGASSQKWSNVYATKFIGALQGNADSATKVSTLITSAAEHYPLLFGSSAAADAAMTNSLSSIYKNSTNKVYFIPSEGRLVAPKMSATSFVGNLTGNVTGNLTGVASHVDCIAATNNVDRPILVTNESNQLHYSSKVKLNYSTGNVTAPTFTGNLIGTADAAKKTVGTLTLKTSAETKTFNGSADVTFEVTPAKLGLTKAVLYLGKSTTAITDGGTEKPTIDGTQITALTAGNIVIDSSDSREYIWNGTKWEKFGLDGDGAAGNYKPIQAVVGDPTASGNSTTFIDTIAQDANGKITATKKSVNFSGYKPTQTAVNNPTASGNEISFIDTISQNTNGVITASRKTVRGATASQSGVVTTGEQTFAGTKTFNGGIVGNLTGNADTATTATSVIDYGNTASSIQIGYSGTGLTSTTCTHLAGYTSSGKKIKDITAAEVKKWLSLGSAAYTESGDYAAASHSHAGYSVPATYATTSSHSGYYLITINSTIGWMLAFRVRVYKSYVYQDIRFSGYNYGNNYWYSPIAKIVEGDGDATVYFGYTSANNLWVAIPAGNYTGIQISDVVNGYHQTDKKAKDLFTITNVTTLPGTTSHTFDLKAPDNRFAPTGHTHNFADLSNHMVVTNEFNFIPKGYNSDVYFNYRAVGGTGTVNAYRFTNGAGTGGYAPCYATNFITTSDRRMKDNITEIVDASKSLELGFYEFDYKSGGHSAGHVAQEVREVLPEFVHGEETETTHLSVDYTGLHSVQIKALKDEVDTLKTENKELRERLEKLEALLEKLV